MNRSDLSDIELHPNINGFVHGDYEVVTLVFEFTPTEKSDIANIFDLDLGEKFTIEVKSSWEDKESYLHVNITPKESQKQLWKSSPSATANQERMKIEDKFLELGIEVRHVKFDELKENLESPSNR